MSSSEAHTNEPGEERFLSNPPDPPPPYVLSTAPRLRKPIAIPATNAKLGSPFLRAYPPLLAQYGLAGEDFLTFLDDLNRVAVANPPVQILGLAGTILGFVPLHTAQLVGHVVKTAADVATYGISRGRTEHCLREANRDVFAPRGLKVEIAKLDALAKLAGIPILDAESGNIDKKAPLLEPLEDAFELNSLGVQQRRLRALEPWIEPLELALLPDVNVPSGVLGRLSAAASERQRRKGEERLMKGRKKAFEGYNEDTNEAQEDYDKDMRKLERREAKARAKKGDDSEKLDKRLQKVERKREKAIEDYEKERDKVEKHRLKDDKEDKGIRKIMWLVIRNVGDPSGLGPNPDVPE